MRASKTVNGVTHYYTYDGLKLIREEWGNNVLVFLYDAYGSPIGMQYRTTSYAEDVWDTYYYEKNLQGDVIAIYSATGTKLVSYTYDAWGCFTRTDVASNVPDVVKNNPITYRGYYYDDDLDLYYLATRYYDPETCRFITADSYVSTGQGILGYNRYAYCGNNPVMYVDYTGEIATPILIVVIVLAATALVTSTILVHDALRASNLEHNTALDNHPYQNSHNKLRDDQNVDPAAKYMFGLFHCDFNGCEAIAVHNAKVMKGIETSLSATIDDFHSTWAINGVSGVFGGNPYQIGRVLNKNGIDYTVVTADEMNEPGVYIVSYWNSGTPTIHTIAVRYTGKNYIPYNYHAKEPFSPTSLGIRYIRGYYLGE